MHVVVDEVPGGAVVEGVDHVVVAVIFVAVQIGGSSPVACLVSLPACLPACLPATVTIDKPEK